MKYGLSLLVALAAVDNNAVVLFIKKQASITKYLIEISQLT